MNMNPDEQRYEVHLWADGERVVTVDGAIIAGPVSREIAVLVAHQEHCQGESALRDMIRGIERRKRGDA